MNNSQDSSWVGCTNSLFPGGSQLEVLKTGERSLAVHLLTCRQRHTHIYTWVICEAITIALLGVNLLTGFRRRSGPFSSDLCRLVCLIQFFSPGFPEMTLIFAYALFSSPQQTYIESDNLSTCRDKLLSVPAVWVAKIRWYHSHGSADEKSFSNLKVQSRGAVVL